MLTDFIVLIVILLAVLFINAERRRESIED